MGNENGCFQTGMLLFQGIGVKQDVSTGLNGKPTFLFHISSFRVYAMAAESRFLFVSVLMNNCNSEKHGQASLCFSFNPLPILHWLPLPPRSLPLLPALFLPASPPLLSILRALVPSALYFASSLSPCGCYWAELLRSRPHGFRAGAGRRAGAGEATHGAQHRLSPPPRLRERLPARLRRPPGL